MTDYLCACGKPAACGARDIRETPNDGLWATFEYVGPWRCGCEMHPPKRGRVLRLNPNRNYALSADDIKELREWDGG